MSITIGSIVISRGLNRQSSDWYYERPNMAREILADGSVVTFDESTTKIVRGVLGIDAVLPAEAIALKGYLANNIRILRFAFSIIPDACSDVGAGVGATLSDCILDLTEASLEGIVTPYGEFNRYSIRLPYRAVVETLSGNWVEE